MRRPQRGRGDRRPNKLDIFHWKRKVLGDETRHGRTMENEAATFIFENGFRVVSSPPPIRTFVRAAK